MDDLKAEIYRLYDVNIKLTLEEYNSLIHSCVSIHEMAAVVYLYDRMKEQGITPNNHTFSLINKLHSKTCKESNIIYIKGQDYRKLPARRRIHKIMKGHNYSDNYNSALEHLEKVKIYLDTNPEIKNYGRIKLAKSLQRGCNITFNEARYIITNLKRTKYLKQDNNCGNTLTLDLNNPLPISKNINRLKQTNITNYFKKT